MVLPKMDPRPMMGRVEMVRGACPTDDRSDEACAAAACRDRREFVHLYDRYVKRIESYVLARTRNASQVDDLVSATFMRALTKINTYRPGKGTFAAWLFAIARNVVNDSHREWSRSRGTEQSERADQEAGPETDLLRRESDATVRSALRTLTADQQDALALRYASELPFRDVARALGKSEPAAKMLVQRGLHALRRQLEETP